MTERVEENVRARSGRILVAVEVTSARVIKASKEIMSERASVRYICDYHLEELSVSVHDRVTDVSSRMWRCRSTCSVVI
jgi:hypothetical protein